MFGLDTAVIVGILTLLGGLLLKWLDWFLNRGERMNKKDKDERDEFRTTIAGLKQEIADQRKEFKDEILAYKNEVKELREDLDEWKLKYYNLQEEMIQGLSGKKDS